MQLVMFVLMLTSLAWLSVALPLVLRVHDIVDLFICIVLFRVTIAVIVEVMLLGLLLFALPLPLHLPQPLPLLLVTPGGVSRAVVREPKMMMVLGGDGWC